MDSLRIKIGELFELSADGMGEPVALAVVGAGALAALIFGAVMIFRRSGS